MILNNQEWQDSSPSFIAWNISCAEKYQASFKWVPTKSSDCKTRVLEPTWTAFKAELKVR